MGLADRGPRTDCHTHVCKKLGLQVGLSPGAIGWTPSTSQPSLCPRTNPRRGADTAQTYSCRDTALRTGDRRAIIFWCFLIFSVDVALHACPLVMHKCV